MPQPRKLTPTVERKILRAIREGHYQQDAAFLADVSPRSLSRWLAEGRSESSRYHRFYLKYQTALIEAKQAQLKKIYKGDEIVQVVKNGAGQTLQRILTRRKKTGDIRWLLAKRFPEQFGDGLAGMLEGFQEKYGVEFAETFAEMLAIAEAERATSVTYEEDELSGDSAKTASQG